MKFKVAFDKVEARKAAEEEKHLEHKKTEAQKAKELAKKCPDRYLPLIDTVDIPYNITDKGTVCKLNISAIRNGNDDEDDIVNEVMLDVRTFIKKIEDEDFRATKKGIYIPMKYAEHLANTILEVVEDLRNKGINF